MNRFKMSDKRFSRLTTDPKFRTVSRKEKKVNIDKRFRDVFKKGNKFAASESFVDARGRPKMNAAGVKDGYTKFYRLADKNASDQDSSDSEDREDAGSKKATVKKKMEADIKSKLLDHKVDYARGDANLYSDSSSSDDDSASEDSSDYDSDEQRDESRDEEWDKWGELDHEAETTTDPTSRVAVCNMNWDRVGAQDIYIAMSSFCPTGPSGVQSVRIYKSEFGKKRMLEEETLGPEELRGEGGRGNDEQSSSADEQPRDEDVDEMDKKAMERVRKYQVSRLKYYYAVVDFDSDASANHVYEACNGVEYELSATRFDLRFIPNDMEFEDEPTSSCESLPDPEKYRPKMFSTTALTLGKVDLTWDEADPDRSRAMRRAFDEAGLDGAEGSAAAAAAMAYIAMSSDDEEEQDEAKVASGKSGEEEEDDDVDTISKYKALLAGVVQQESSKVQEVGGLEISWGPREKVKKDLEQKDAEKMTPWEQYLDKKKKKQQTKRDGRKLRNETEDEKPFSDDELPEGVDFDDPFFKDEPGHMDRDAKHAGKKQLKKRKRGKDRDATIPGGEDKDLSLLLMDNEGDQKHFDYKDIVSNSKKTKKKRRKIIEGDNTAEFEVDLGDQRFHAVFQNPEFNVDPSNPHFKKTKSMQNIVEEKQRRASKAFKSDIPEETEKRPKLEKGEKSSTSSTSSKSLELLVKAVKNKSKDTSKSKSNKKKRNKVWT